MGLYILSGMGAIGTLAHSLISDPYVNVDMINACCGSYGGVLVIEIFIFEMLSRVTVQGTGVSKNIATGLHLRFGVNFKSITIFTFRHLVIFLPFL